MIKNFGKIIPFLVASCLVLFHAAGVWTTPVYATIDGTLVSANIIEPVRNSLVGLTVILIFILCKQKYWKWLFLGLIILSFTPLFQFTNSSFSVGIIVGIGGVYPNYSFAVFNRAFIFKFRDVPNF